MNDLINFGFYVKNSPVDFAKPKTIIVIGMARSGTSMVARLLDGNGIFLGSQKDNAVFEDVEIAKALESENETEFKNLISTRYKQHKIWGFKRPSSINYIDTIVRNVTNPHFIVVYRDLFAIALRNHISMEANLDESLALASKTYAKINDFIAHTKAPTFILSYEKAISKKAKFIKGLFDFLGMKLSPLKLEKLIKLIEIDRALYLQNSNINKFISSVEATDKEINITANYPLKPNNSPVISTRINDIENTTKLTKVVSGRFTIPFNELIEKNQLNKVVARDNVSKEHLTNSPLIFRAGDVENMPKVFLFLHIPKTAGTSFRIAIEKLYSPEDFFPNKAEIKNNKGQYPSFDSLKNLDINRIRKIRFIAGHYTKSSSNKVPHNYTYITFFRKPEERIISNLIHFKANDKRCENMSLNEIFEARKNGIVDLQIKYILDDLRQYQKLKALSKEEFSNQIEKELQKIDFIGIKEKLDESIDFFNKCYGFKIEHLKNQNPKKIDLEPSPVLLKKIKQVTEYENLLYEAAISIFEKRLNPNLTNV